MFTGIVTDVGRLSIVERSESGAHLAIESRLAADGLETGESIAVAGVCLSVESADSGGFRATASPETLRRTTLGHLAPGDRVNLERSLRLGDRCGGHLVQGHVDGVGQVRSIRREGVSRVMSIGLAEDLASYLAARGSVAVDGVSLTVGATFPDGFEVTVIPLTLRATTLDRLRVGDAVNLEVDVLARYVARRLEAGASPAAGRGRLDSASGERTELSAWLSGGDLEA